MWSTGRRKGTGKLTVVIDWFLLVDSEDLEGWESLDVVWSSDITVLIHIDGSDLSDSLQSGGDLLEFGSEVLAVSAPKGRSIEN